MKTLEVEKIVKSIIYVAFDGTQFDEVDKCMEYESSYILKKVVKNIETPFGLMFILSFENEKELDIYKGVIYYFGYYSLLDKNEDQREIANFPAYLLETNDTGICEPISETERDLILMHFKPSEIEK